MRKPNASAAKEEAGELATCPYASLASEVANSFKKERNKPKPKPMCIVRAAKEGLVNELASFCERFKTDNEPEKLNSADVVRRETQCTLAQPIMGGDRMDVVLYTGPPTTSQLR